MASDARSPLTVRVHVAPQPTCIPPCRRYQVIVTYVGSTSDSPVSSQELAVGHPLLQLSTPRGTLQVAATSSLSNAEVAAFGGIPYPTSIHHHSSTRIQEQPDTNDLQTGQAMRTVKLRDTETTSVILYNKKFSVLYFSEVEIVQKASRLGVSLRNKS